MKRKKSGFTIIELVIVVAVIGILSGVLIPTFTNLVNESKYAADQAMLGVLNTKIAVGKHQDHDFNTYDEVLDYLDDFGYTPYNLVTQAPEYLLWNAANKEFLLQDNLDTLDNAYKYFMFYDEVPSLEEQKCSIYLRNNEYASDEINIKVGFDAGKNTLIKSVNYENDEEQEVVIRVNGSNLTITGPNDKIHRYGNANYVTINEVSHFSYFECGSSEFTSITSGRIVLSNEADVGGLFINGNDAIVASVQETKLPTITRGAGVTSTSLQVVDKTGDIKQESSISITNDGITVTGDVSSDLVEDMTKNLENSVDQDTQRLATKYEVRVGAAVEGDESNYYRSLQEALSSILSLKTATTLYLLRDVIVDESLSYSGAAAASHTLNLQNFSIIGNGCTPININVTKSYNFTITKGSLVGDTNNPAIISKYASAAYYTHLSNVDTVGEIRDVSTSGSTIRVNGGRHTNCSFSGNVVFNTVKSTTTYFDCDPANRLNNIRCECVVDGDFWKVTTKTQNTSKAFIQTYDSYTRYATIEEALENDDFPIVSIRMLKNHSETLVSSNTKSLTLSSGTTSKNSKKYTFTGSLSTSGAITFQYGTYDVSYINCKTMTVSTSATVDIAGGTVTAIAASGNASVLNMNGGTCTGKVTVTKKATTNVNIIGGIYNNVLTITTSGTKAYTITVTGGTYVSEKVVKTFYKFADETLYSYDKNSDKTYSINEIPQQQS